MRTGTRALVVVLCLHVASLSCPQCPLLPASLAGLDPFICSALFTFPLSYCHLHDSYLFSPASRHRVMLGPSRSLMGTRSSCIFSSTYLQLYLSDNTRAPTWLPGQILNKELGERIPAGPFPYFHRYQLWGTHFLFSATLPSLIVTLCKIKIKIYNLGETALGMVFLTP